MKKTLADIRLEKGLTQNELAEKLGCSQETISQYETGSRTPSITKAREIASFFGVSVADIFFGADISKRNVST